MMKRVVILFLFAVCPILAFSQSKGYEFSVDASAGLGLSNLSKYSVGASVINGYRLSDKFSIGLGVGFKYAETLYYYSEDSTLGNYDSRDNKFLVPVFLRAKFNFTDGAIAPFITGDFGYTFDVGKNPNKNIEGFFAEPIVGVDFKSKGATWFLGIGANVQQHHYEYFRISDVIKSSEKTVKGVVTTLALHFGVAF